MTNSPGESEKPFVYKSETAANRTSLLPAVRSITPPRAAGMGHCPNCNASVLPGTSICPQCGHFLRALAKQIRCRRCGQRASSNLVICPHCGRDLMPAPSRLLVWGAPVVLVALFFGVLLGRGHNGNPVTWTQNKVASGVTWITRLGDSMAPGISITQITPTPTTLLMKSSDQSPAVTAVQIAENTQNGLTQSVVISNVAPIVTSTVAAVIVAPVISTATVADTSTPLPTAQPTASFTPLPTRTEVPTVAATATPVDTATTVATATATNPPTVVKTATAINTPAATPIAKATTGRALVLVATSTPTGGAAVNGQSNSGPAPQTSITPTNAATATLAPTTKTPKAALTLVPTASATPTTTPTSPPVTSANVASKTYEIQAGDTLGAIAVRFDVTNDALMAANNLTGDDIYRLRPGQSLIIPTTDSPDPSAVPTAAAAARTYVIQAGDTPLQIAGAFGITAAELLAANNLSGDDARSLRVGQVLTIPGDDQVAAESQATPTATPQSTVTPQPVPPTTTRASVEAASTQSKLRLDAPQLRSPESNAAISCNGNNALIWQAVPFMLDNDRFVLHLGFVNGHDTDGKETVAWVLEQIQSPNNTAWNMDPSLCALAPQDLGRQWRWYVEVIGVDNQPVSLPSPYWGFSWN